MPRDEQCLNNPAQLLQILIFEEITFSYHVVCTCVNVPTCGFISPKLSGNLRKNEPKIANGMVYLLKGTTFHIQQQCVTAAQQL